MPSQYETPFSSRYASKEMQYLFSPGQQVPHLAAGCGSRWPETEQELGLPITDEQIAELKAHADDINYDVAAAREKEVRHDVMAHVYAYGRAVPQGQAASSTWAPPPATWGTTPT